MALDVYLTNTPVTLTVSLVNEAGEILNVNAIQYRVVDQEGVELVAQTTLVGFAAGDSEAIVTIPASLNQIAETATREIRSVELICEMDGGTIAFAKVYALEALEPLRIGVNSFQTFPMAQLTALDIPNIDAWHAATEQQKVAALIDARENIIQLNFNLLTTNLSQNSLHYSSQSGVFAFDGNLRTVTEDEFIDLPERFKQALRRAQVAQANAILGGEPNEARRSLGIIEDVVGESRQRYRETQGLTLPLCRRALSYLSEYISYSKRIGRA